MSQFLKEISLVDYRPAARVINQALGIPESAAGVQSVVSPATSQQPRGGSPVPGRVHPGTSRLSDK